jgi:hypothetical protein
VVVAELAPAAPDNSYEQAAVATLPLSDRPASSAVEALLPPEPATTVVAAVSVEAQDLAAEREQMEALLQLMGPPFARSCAFWMGMGASLLMGALMGLVALGFFNTFEEVRASTRQPPAALVLHTIRICGSLLTRGRLDSPIAQLSRLTWRTDAYTDSISAAAGAAGGQLNAGEWWWLYVTSGGGLCVGCLKVGSSCTGHATPSHRAHVHTVLFTPHFSHRTVHTALFTGGLDVDRPRPAQTHRALPAPPAHAGHGGMT